MFSYYSSIGVSSSIFVFLPANQGTCLQLTGFYLLTLNILAHHFPKTIIFAVAYPSLK